MSDTVALNAPPAADTVSFRTWVAVIGATLGAFLAVLNIQITNAALYDIEGGIGTGGTSGAWITTSYLIGEIVVIPLTDFLSRVFSVRRFMLVNIALFLVFSVLCGQAGTLGEMIVYRGLQGFTGGVLIPLAFTIVVTSLPKSKQQVGMALFALGAMFAPAIGPTIGGYLTEVLSWPYVFYVNIIPGLAMLGALAWALDATPMQLQLLKDGDWAGIATLAVGLASLQTVLEEGNELDWFGSALIVKLSVVAVIALAAFTYIELTRPNPVVNLRLLVRRNFGFGTLSNFFLGFGLYGSGYLLTTYLAQTQGYNPQQIGAVIMWTGLPQLVLIPLVPALLKRFDGRVLVATGLLMFALSCFMNLTLTQDTAADQLLLPNLIRAVGMSVVLAPLSGLAMAGMERENVGAASGLFNMMRNLGGAFGTAALLTFFTKREHFHSNVINAHVSLTDPATQDRLHSLQQFFLQHGADPVAAGKQAIIAIGHAVHNQAALMSFGDTFALLGTMLVLAAASVALLKKASGSAAGAH